MVTLVVGACGQIGTELVRELRRERGPTEVLATDVRRPAGVRDADGPFAVLDVLDRQRLEDVIREHDVEEVYGLAALLSAGAEERPGLAWRVNVDGLRNLLEVCLATGVERVFWPSSIAVFGETTPRDATPQRTVTEPTTVYGISKLFGERWCERYREEHGLDVRSVRFPGVIGPPPLHGRGTTDYTVEACEAASDDEPYRCFLGPDVRLPMIEIGDAVRAATDLMAADRASLREGGSYNVHGFSVTPAELEQELRAHVPSFAMTYEPDERHQIALTWPASLDDGCARDEWGWAPEHDLPSTVEEVLSACRDPRTPRVAEVFP